MPPSPLLELEAYGASFGRRVIFSELDLSLPIEGVSVLMGPVKTGKSTLMRSLAGLNETNPTFRQWGQARMGGRAIGPDWRPALVQQHAQVLQSSVEHALVYWLRQRETRPAGSWADAARAMLAHHGLEKVIPDPSIPMLALPTVWQRAVGILALALTKPPLLCIDEPTYGLPDSEGFLLIDWLRHLSQNQPLWVTLHHQGQAKRLGSHIVLVGGGRTLFSGPTEAFFGRHANPWAEQFVRTGSVSVPSPDARPEDLDEGVEPPPPLPETARAALAEFEASAPPAVSTLVASVASSPEKKPPVSAMAAGLPAAPSSSPILVKQPAKPPPISPHGVEIASMVGRAIMSDYRGPQGFHWIVPGKLAGCAEPGIVSPMEYDLGLLKDMGITYLITLTEKDLDQDALQDSGLRNLHLPIIDRHPPTISQAYMLVRRMQVLLDRGEVLAVHCKAGIGRTGTMLAAWMIREGGLSAKAAIDRLRRIHPAYVQTAQQEAFLEQFEGDLVKRMS